MIENSKSVEVEKKLADHGVVCRRESECDAGQSRTIMYGLTPISPHLLGSFSKWRGSYSTLGQPMFLQE